MKIAAQPKCLCGRGRHSYIDPACPIHGKIVRSELAPVPQETPAQHTPLPWKVGPQVLHQGLLQRAIFHGDDEWTGEYVATVTELNAELIVKCVNRDPAFQKLVLVAQLVTLAPLQHGLAVPNELMDLATEALLLTKETR